MEAERLAERQSGREARETSSDLWVTAAPPPSWPSGVAP